MPVYNANTLNVLMLGIRGKRWHHVYKSGSTTHSFYRGKLGLNFKFIRKYLLACNELLRTHLHLFIFSFFLCINEPPSVGRKHTGLHEASCLSSSSGNPMIVILGIFYNVTVGLRNISINVSLPQKQHASATVNHKHDTVLIIASYVCRVFSDWLQNVFTVWICSFL